MIWTEMSKEEKRQKILELRPQGKAWKEIADILASKETTVYRWAMRNVYIQTPRRSSELSLQAQIEFLEHENKILRKLVLLLLEKITFQNETLEVMLDR